MLGIPEIGGCGNNIFGFFPASWVVDTVCNIVDRCCYQSKNGRARERRRSGGICAAPHAAKMRSRRSFNHREVARVSFAAQNYQ